MTADADRSGSGRPVVSPALAAPSGLGRRGAARLPADPVHAQMVEHVGRPDPVIFRSVLNDGSQLLAFYTGECHAPWSPAS